MSLGYLGPHVATSTHKSLIAHILFWPGYILFCLGNNSWAEPVALLYPEVREPYQQVFLNIAEGIEQEIGHELKYLVITPDTSKDKTIAWLRQHKITGVIAMGNHRAYSFGPELNLPIVFGAVAFQAENLPYSGISLNPNPALLFNEILHLKPDITTIHVVYDPKRNQREIEHAIVLATQLKIKLLSYPTDDLRHAAVAYRNIQKKMDAETEALWLPLGGPARDKSILQNILEIAWANNHIVFSSNLADVKRGVMFAMYPDNVGMGHELGKLLKNVESNPNLKPDIYFTQSLFKAINRRTAEHVNLRLSNQTLGAYDFVYPPR